MSSTINQFNSNCRSMNLKAGIDYLLVASSVEVEYDLGLHPEVHGTLCNHHSASSGMAGRR